MIVLEQSAQAFAALDQARGGANGLFGMNQLVFQPLMVSLVGTGLTAMPEASRDRAGAFLSHRGVAEPRAKCVRPVFRSPWRLRTATGAGFARWKTRLHWSSPTPRHDPLVIPGIEIEDEWPSRRP